MDFKSVPQAPVGTVFKLNMYFAKYQGPRKVLLGAGAYRDNEGKPFVLEAVVKAKNELANQPEQDWTHEYQMMRGHVAFCQAAQELLLGSDLYPTVSQRTATLQTLSGTGACRLGCAFLKKYHKQFDENGEVIPTPTIYFPNPTWANHIGIAKEDGLDVKFYTYLDSTNPTRLDFEGMLKDLKNAPKGSIIMLHLCAHNPTGVDPTMEQWKEITKCCQDVGHQMFIDAAYQGFASGDLEADAAPLRMMIGEEFNMNVFVASSFSKNMGLYGERVGCLHIIGPDGTSAKNVVSQMAGFVRPMYTSPPLFGVSIAHKVMTQPELRAMWEKDLKVMVKRIKEMRTMLRTRLEEKTEGRNWDHITSQIGMFSYTGLTPEQNDACGEKGVFMLSPGRVNVAGLNTSNIDYVADVIASVLEGTD